MPIEASPLALLRAPTPHPQGVNPDTLRGINENQRGLLWASELVPPMDMGAPAVIELRRYHEGIQPIRFSTEAWRETYGKDFGLVTDNWCRLVIEAATERMNVQGFRFGGDDADDEAWRLWQASRMDLDSDTLHSEALVTGRGYVMVWPGADGQPEITVEDPLHTYVELDPANRRRRVAGMKRWERRDGTWEGLVFTPDHWWRVESSLEGGGWVVIDHGPHKLGVVPLIPAVNEPDLYGVGKSDLAPVLHLQDAVNKLLSDEMIVAEHAGYPQRVILGAEIPEPDENGAYPVVLGGPNRWQAIEDENATIQELSVADLSNFGKSIEQKVQHIAALTRTPPHYLLGQVVNVSADALRAAESGLVSRVKRRNKRFGEVWEEAMRLSFAILGDLERAKATSAETMWMDPETPSEAARVDALVKMRTLGIPEQVLWERWGMTPQEVERTRALRDAEIQMEGLAAGISGPSGLPTQPE